MFGPWLGPLGGMGPLGKALLEIYGSIGIFAGVAQGLYLAAAFLLGGHLLLRARRSRELTQLLLGLHLLLAMGVGYVLLSVGVVLVELSAEPPRRLLAWLMGAGYAATILGLMATLLFNQRVFRPGERWAAVFVGLASAVMWVGWAGYGASGGFAGGRFEGTWLWVQLGGMLATNFWVAAEPLAYHQRMRRRLRLGLADPVVVNRFLLWGLGSLARAVMIGLGPLSALCLAHAGADAAFAISSAILVVASACGLFTSVAYWLTFFPTPGYARWLTSRAARGQSA